MARPRAGERFVRARRRGMDLRLSAHNSFVYQGLELFEDEGQRMAVAGACLC